LIRPSAKADRFVKTSQSGDIKFAKAFWNLLEMSSAKLLGKVLYSCFQHFSCSIFRSQLIAPMVACSVLLKIPV
jgi:hypothetical protein